jgi:hypothetical protein
MECGPSHSCRAHVSSGCSCGGFPVKSVEAKGFVIVAPGRLWLGRVPQVGQGKAGPALFLASIAEPSPNTALSCEAFVCAGYADMAPSSLPKLWARHRQVTHVMVIDRCTADVYQLANCVL